MAAEIVEFTTPDDFLEFFDKMNESDGYWLGWFCGSIDPNTGITWCDDCERAEPHIENAIKEYWGGKKVAKCIITRSEWKGVADHPFRIHPQLKLTGVPTLIIFQKNAPLIKVDDSGLEDDDELLEMFSVYQ